MKMKNGQSSILCSRLFQCSFNFIPVHALISNDYIYHNHSTWMGMKLNVKSVSVKIKVDKIYMLLLAFFILHLTLIHLQLHFLILNCED
jgi:hypothetical protein